MTEPMPHVTKHAHERWQQRCRGRCWQQEWSGAVRASKNTRRKILRHARGRKAETPTAAHNFYLNRNSGIVFVLDETRTRLLTVFRYGRRKTPRCDYRE